MGIEAGEVQPRCERGVEGVMAAVEDWYFRGTRRGPGRVRVQILRRSSGGRRVKRGNVDDEVGSEFGNGCDVGIEFSNKCEGQ